MATDEWGQMLGSMDRNQLAALAQEIENRGLSEFAMYDPRTGTPETRPGAGLPPSIDDLNQMSWADKFRNTAGRLSVVGQYKHYKQGKKDRKKKKAYKQAVEAEKARQKNVLAERLKAVQNQLRTVDLRDKVNQQFRDLELEGLFDRVVKQGQDAAALGIAQQHDDLTRQSGFDTVSKGLGGSSVDADRIADIQTSQEQALAQSAASAQQQRMGLSRNLDQQRRGLLESVSGSNPGEEARLQGELRNIQTQAQSVATGAGQGIYGMGIQQEGLAGQSQAIGGLLSSYANMYNQPQARSY